MDKRRIAIVTNLAWPLYNFRRTLAEELTSRGHEVIAIAAPDGTEHKLKEANIRFIPLKNFHSTGQNPLQDLRLFKEFRTIFREERIDFAYLYNAKPMIYGGLAATIKGIPYVSTVAGLGNPFTGSGNITRVIMLAMFKVAMWRAFRVFFHNREHRELFTKWGISSAAKSAAVAGSGVDMDRFPCALHQKSDEPFTFLMFSRLLISKGAPLYVEAARLLKKQFPEVRFWLLGPLDGNKYSVSQAQLDNWVQKGWVEYLGETTEVQQYIQQAHVVVYPSYYAEGTPRALLEGASMCKPLITSDNVGCHDVVEDGKNGYLVAMNDLSSLVSAMTKMIKIDDESYQSMAVAGRQLIERCYDKRHVIEKYVEALESLYGLEKTFF